MEDCGFVSDEKRGPHPLSSDHLVPRFVGFPVSSLKRNFTRHTQDLLPFILVSSPTLRLNPFETITRLASERQVRWFAEKRKIDARGSYVGGLVLGQGNDFHK